jgi:serine/threonine protein kinase
LRAQERLARLAARGGYQIVCEIGCGPRSTVYHALHGPHKQPVALKVFDAGVCTQAEWQDRLDRGASTWAALTHPQVVAIQEAGWWDDAPFVATPLVPNRCLSSRLNGKPLPVIEAMYLVEQLAEIVGFCHRQGIVHGNLKPSNILVAADGIPRITDFRLTGGLFLSDAIRDRTTKGVRYLAPELIDHPEAEPHRNADIYGLGVILYELLTGQAPLADSGPVETRERVRSETPAPPSRWNSDVRPELDFICLRCLRKNPWRRYARAYDLQSSLRHLQK